MYKSIICCILLFCIFSCKQDKKVPDVSSISLSNQNFRIEQILKTFSDSSKLADFEDFWLQFPSFNEVYYGNILGFQTDELPLLALQTHRLVNHETYQLLIQKLDSIYTDDSFIQEIQQSFKFIQHYFPSWTAPNIYTFISEFGIAHFLFDDGERDGVGIGMDYFLGNSVPYHLIDPSNPVFSTYLTRTFDKDHLTSKTVNAVLQEMYPIQNYNQVLDYMIYHGKILNLIEHVVPTISDSILHEYTAAQMQWCQDNEYEIWAFLIDENVLYDQDLRKYNKLINPSPTSPGMPKESPGRTANYIGYRIVQSYLDNTGVPLNEMMEMDSKTILGKSKYKPKRK